MGAWRQLIGFGRPGPNGELPECSDAQDTGFRRPHRVPVQNIARTRVGHGDSPSDSSTRSESPPARGWATGAGRVRRTTPNDAERRRAPADGDTEVLTEIRTVQASGIT